MLIVLLVPTTAAATPVKTGRLALVIGSNPGGPGQTRLRYAEKDAKRFATVMKRVGRFDEAVVLYSPSPQRVERAFAKLQRSLASYKDAGQSTQVVVFYSGHASAKALHLGRAELPLGTLKRYLAALPADLVITVIDACQSGEITRAKGVAPAKDFTVSSQQILNVSGSVLVASSAANELSQESDALGASYFSHYFTTGLLGAADRNNDSQVTIDEAYEFAYHQTLSATARTRIGRQHPTLKSDVSGHGQIVLADLRKQNRRLRLPRTLDATIVVEHKKSKTVAAEIHKAPTRASYVALARGQYQVVVRQGKRVLECAIDLRSTRAVNLKLANCSVLDTANTRSKGGMYFDKQFHFDLGFGVLSGRRSAYTKRLEDFGYQRQDSINFGPEPDIGTVSGHYQLLPYLSAGANLSTFGGGAYGRDRKALGKQYFDWSSTAFGVSARGNIGPGLFSDITFFELYGTVGVGLAHVSTRLDDRAQDRVYRQSQLGYYVEANLGMHIYMFSGFSSFLRNVGVFAEYGIAYAPVLENELGDLHDVGGQYFRTGISVRY